VEPETGKNTKGQARQESQDKMRPNKSTMVGVQKTLEGDGLGSTIKEQLQINLKHHEGGRIFTGGEDVGGLHSEEAAFKTCAAKSGKEKVRMRRWRGARLKTQKSRCRGGGL